MLINAIHSQVCLTRASMDESFGMALTAGSPAQIFTIEPGREGWVLLNTD